MARQRGCQGPSSGLSARGQGLAVACQPGSQGPGSGLSARGAGSGRWSVSKGVRVWKAAGQQGVGALAVAGRIARLLRQVGWTFEASGLDF